MTAPARRSSWSTFTAGVRRPFGPATTDVHELAATTTGAGDSQRVSLTADNVHDIDPHEPRFESGQVEQPRGWAAVVLAGLSTRAPDQQALATLRLSDGGRVRLTVPTHFPIGGGHD
jgi:hypothetical protein